MIREYFVHNIPLKYKVGEGHGLDVRLGYIFKLRCIEKFLKILLKYHSYYTLMSFMNCNNLIVVFE